MLLFCLLACPGRGERNSFKDLNESWLKSESGFSSSSSSSGSPELRSLINPGEKPSIDPKVGETPVSNALPFVVFLSLAYMSVKALRLRRSLRA
jgi:hypothetical protein